MIGKTGARHPARIRQVVVVVPARNEEDLVEECLRSVRLAAVEARSRYPDVSVRILLVADACSDRTEERARAIAGVEVLSVGSSRVGAARATGVDAALLAIEAEQLAHVLLANTDADSRVPANWISHLVELVDAGADVVVGTVRPDPEALTRAQNDGWLRTHRRGFPNGHVHGANLGIRASAYRAAGGFESLDEHEDNQLVARLADGGATMVASDVAEVITSARFVGRTPGGYAGYLAATL